MKKEELNQNEKELLKLINSHPDREYALLTAIDIIVKIAEQHESSQ